MRGARLLPWRADLRPRQWWRGFFILSHHGVLVPTFDLRSIDRLWAPVRSDSRQSYLHAALGCLVLEVCLVAFSLIALRLGVDPVEGPRLGVLPILVTLPVAAAIFYAFSKREQRPAPTELGVGEDGLTFNFSNGGTLQVPWSDTDMDPFGIVDWGDPTTRPKAVSSLPTGVRYVVHSKGVPPTALPDEAYTEIVRAAAERGLEPTIDPHVRGDARFPSITFTPIDDD